MKKTFFKKNRILLLIVLIAGSIFVFLRYQNREIIQHTMRDNTLYILSDSYINNLINDLSLGNISNSYPELEPEFLSLNSDIEDKTKIIIFGDNLDTFKYLPAQDKEPIVWYSKITSNLRVGNIYNGMILNDFKEELEINIRVPDSFIITNLEGGLEVKFIFEDKKLTKFEFSNTYIN